MPPAIDITGQRFGRLVALEIVDYYGKTRIKRWRCQCDCGNTVNVLMTSLRAGKTLSCGCMHREIIGEMGRQNLRHGERTRRDPPTKEYTAWVNMKSRCLNPRNPRFPEWGGRGITICAEWLHSFETFLQDMGRCPPDHSLERIDNAGPYTKMNCVWATAEKQARNRRPRSKSIRGPQ